MTKNAALPKALPLTPLQLDCLRVITECFDTHGYAPTVADLCSELELKSKAQAVHLLDRIEEKGWIKRHHRKVRGIEVLRRPQMPDTSGLEFIRSEDVVPPTAAGDATAKVANATPAWTLIESYVGEPNASPIAWWWSAKHGHAIDEAILDEEGRVCGKGGCGAHLYTHILPILPTDYPAPPSTGEAPAHG